MIPHQRTPLVLTLAAFLLAVTLAACGDANLVTSTDDEATAAELSELAARLATDLDLSTEQVNAVNDHLAVDDKPAPGHLWTAAAALQHSLTDAQKATLFEQAAERRAERGEGMRDRRLNRAFDGEGQGQPRRLQRRGEGGHGLAEDFLTPEQQAAMQTLRETQREAMQDLVAARDEGTLSAEAFREQAKALREAHHEAMQNLLTDEQKATLEAKREAMKARFSEQRDAADAARVEALGLTADQEVALEELREAQRAETRALVEEARSGGDVDRQALRTAMKTLREAHKAALADVLTPVQMEITDIHNVLAGTLAARRGGRRGGPRGGGQR